MPGVIAAGSPITAAAGAAMLEQGGNAVDAAVAAAFASFIAEIGVVNLGGSGIAHIYDPQTGRSVVYDFFSTMPGAGRADGLDGLDFHKVTIDFGSATQDFHVGRGAVAVPGNVIGLCRLADELGTLPLRTLLEPTLQLARDGHALRPFQADTIDLLGGIYTDTAEMRAVFAPGGRLLRAGETLRLPDLYTTLLELAESGVEYARTGPLAQAILADQAARGGLLTAADLATYRVARLEPIRIAYRGYDVLLPPPCSSGGVLTGFTLKLLNAFDVPHWAPHSAESLRLIHEAMSATTRARVHWERALATMAPADAVAAFLDDAFVQPYIDAMAQALNGAPPSPAAPDPKGPNNTSHLSVIDGAGMAVSLTTTAGETAGYIVPGTGYIPNNMLGEEDVNPHGWHKWPVGARIATMMTPMIVLQDGQTRMVTGSGGSARIRSAVMQVLSNLLDHRMPLVGAVEQPRVHVDNGVLQCELGFDSAEVDRLERWGYRVNRWRTSGIYFGGAHSVSRTPDGALVAAGDPRRDGHAIMLP